MTTAAKTPLLFSDRILRCLKAPGGTDRDDLTLCSEGLHCRTTGQLFPVVDGIPSLYVPAAWETGDVTAKIRSFYETHPFPSYEGLEEFGKLVAKGLSNPFSRDLLTALGYNKTILECGC